MAQTSRNKYRDAEKESGSMAEQASDSTSSSSALS